MPRYAAIDIGSNSIRMEAAETQPGAAARILAADREVTRLGESVFRTGAVDAKSLDAACAVLARMQDQYRRLDVVGVRVVATSAVRDAANQAEFLERAAAAAGSSVEIISGREEARLIHLGVQSCWPQPQHRLLIIDIGGGSAELISSDGGVLRDAYSKPLGAVRLTELFLKDDPPSARQLHQMWQFIEDKLEGPAAKWGGQKFDRAIATSATAAAVVCAVNRVSRARREHADRLRASTADVRRLYEKLAESNLQKRRQVNGIGPRRAEIIVAGACTLLCALHKLKVRTVHYCAAGVRDGIIADLAARGVGLEMSRLSRDQRREVERMSARFGVPLERARKVAQIAHDLFNLLHPLHQLPPHTGKLLEAAVFLHDVGHYISDTGHHKHSYYVVANLDLSGFTNREREVIANLCRYHRKSMPASNHANYQALSPDERQAVALLSPILRLADGLDRGHRQRIDRLECEVRNGQVVIKLSSSNDIDLKQWAAEQADEVFRQAYGKRIAVQKA
jgi:exopolyphosphatase/guanosine-5'-triphosphate,3'-diphosphate pyrophosphatase